MNKLFSWIEWWPEFTRVCVCVCVCVCVYVCVCVCVYVWFNGLFILSFVLWFVWSFI